MSIYFPFRTGNLSCGKVTTRLQFVPLLSVSRREGKGCRLESLEFHRMTVDHSGGGSSSLVAMSYPTLATPWTVAHQASLSKGFTRQEYRSGLPLTSPGDLPDSGIELRSLALQADSLPTEPPGKPRDHSIHCQFPARHSTLKPNEAELGREISSITFHPGVWWRKKGESIWAELVTLHLFS